MPIRLHINVDHVATVRQARLTDEPDPVAAASLAESGGADGITVHLREDRRHIQDRDVRVLMESVRTGVNLELAAADEMLEIALELKPMTVTLVPERREEITTEGGLQMTTAVSDAAIRLGEAGIRASLFIDPDADVIRAAADLGVPAVELHTGEFAESWKRRHQRDGEQEMRTQVQRIRDAAALASSLGLAVHAGHGLTYEYVPLVASIPEIEELNIGHSVVSRALFTGMEQAVREMKDIIVQARRA